MMPSERTDEDIARLVQSGDRDAYGELMRRYEGKPARYGRQFLQSHDQIEDGVQEAFIRAYQNMHGFDATLRFSPWLYRIAHNVFANMLRTRSRSRVFAMDLDALVPHAAYEDPAERERDVADMRRAIEAGMEHLRPDYREILVLYYTEDLSYQEIADVLRIPVGTVGVRLSRARAALKKHLEPSHLV